MSDVIGDVFCKICRKIYRDPHKLPCGHTYCRVPCILPQPFASEAVCHECQIAVPANTLELDLLALQRVKNFEANKPVRCAVCSHYLPNITLCLHCHQKVCVKCKNLHVERLTTVLLTKVMGLRKISHKLHDNERTLKEEGQKLIKEVDNITVILQAACDKALNRAEASLDDIEVNAMASLLQPLDDLPTLKQVVSVMVTQKDNIPNVQTVAELKIIQDQITYIFGELERIENSISCAEQLPFAKIMISRTSKTLAFQVENLKLLSMDPCRPEAHPSRNRNKTNGNPFTRDWARKTIASVSIVRGNIDPLPTATGSTNLDNRRLFVGGLHSSLTQDVFQTYFARFGEIQSVNFAKGWASILFKDVISVLQVLTTAPHVIGSRRVDVKPFFTNDRSHSVRQKRNTNPYHPSTTLQK